MLSIAKRSCVNISSPQLPLKQHNKSTSVIYFTLPYVLQRAYFEISCQKVTKINCAFLVSKHTHTSVYIKHPICMTFRLKNPWVDQNTCMYFISVSSGRGWSCPHLPPLTPFLYSTVNHSSQMRGRSKFLPNNR